MRQRHHLGGTRLAGLGLSLLLAGVLAGGTPALAQESAPTLRARVITPPVDIHAGTCANPQLEPAYELGDMTIHGRVAGPVIVEDPIDDDLDNDGVINADEDRYLEEDLDGDDVLDPGEDRNGNGVLETGIDANGDDIIDAGEEVPTELPPAYYRAESTVDATFDDLFDSPHVVAVHANADEYGTIVACGELTGTEEDGQIVVSLRPANRSGYYGYAVFEQDTDDAPAIPVFGDNTTGVTVYMFVNLLTQRESRTATAAAAPRAADHDGDGVPNADEAGYVNEDLDRDGVLDAGEDLDADGVLDEGIDANGDGLVDDEETIT
ncbi:MAG: hypothetical protein AVDCRST_MAG49-3656 [uncultured Thermomicrobiales bacterium]|uniref:CHRD domain-containing protein n=1 Tax=uncultured Thermomicrobiales bacterium TaxID=1645740 RepID=A0A6J4VA94_9BACT|nr:MAG: hypothetical protein AVDCRST_MAG49-3656 [uncultured Thermomicrobiales bacterium]